MKRYISLSQDELGTLLWLAAILFGGIVRLLPPYLAGFPINDGGLFYAMTKAILDNHFVLPAYVRYNGLTIPFAYPPFGFYIAASLHTLLAIPLLSLFQWLPAIVLVGCVAVFFALARQWLKSPVEAGLAALFFALLPRSIAWPIMGGGVTRSFGQLFFILTVLFVSRLFAERSKKMLAYSILFGALVVLSHPEAAIHTAAICALIFFLQGRDRNGLLLAAATGAGVLVLSAPWWLPILRTFGLTPFLSASQTGLNNTFETLHFVTNFGEESGITFIMVFGFLGITKSLLDRDYFLPLFFLLPFLVEPRNAANMSVVPLALLAAKGVYEVVLPGLQKETAGVSVNLTGRTAPVLVFIGAYLTVGMIYFAANLSVKRVSPQNLEDFAWVQANTPTDSRFLIITGTQDLFWDWTQEWFPLLTNRISETTIQGREWTNGGDFLNRVGQDQSIQQCPSLACIEEAAGKYNMTYNYLYIATRPLENTGRLSQEQLSVELESNHDYRLVYHSPAVMIFEINKQARQSIMGDIQR